MSKHLDVTQRLEVSISEALWDAISNEPMATRVEMILEHVQAKSGVVNVVDASVEDWEFSDSNNGVSYLIASSDDDDEDAL